MSEATEEKGVRAALEPAAMRAVGGVFERLDFDACRYAGAWLGLALYGALGKRRNVAVNNARLALGVSRARANQLARRSCINFGMMFAEFMHQRVATPQEIERRCTLDHLEHVREALAGGRGALLLTAHLGNWELMGARAAREFPLSVVARPTSNAGVQRLIEAPRLAHGLEVISKYESGRGPLRALRQGRALGILPDQYASNEETLLPFFGQPTRFWSSLARLALISRAPVVPAFATRRRPFLADGRILVKISPGWTVDAAEDKEAAVLDGTRRVIAELENVIRAHPDQWLWLHRRWRANDGVTWPA